MWYVFLRKGHFQETVIDVLSSGNKAYQNSAVRFLCSLQLSALKHLRAYAPKIVASLLNRQVLTIANKREELIEVVCDFLRLFKDDISIIESLLRSLDGLNHALKESELLSILNVLLSWEETTLCNYIQVIINLIDTYPSFSNGNKWIDMKNRLYSIGLRANQPSETYKEVHSRLESSFDNSDSSLSIPSSRIGNDTSRLINESSILSHQKNERSDEISGIRNEDSSLDDERYPIQTQNTSTQFGLNPNRLNEDKPPYRRSAYRLGHESPILGTENPILGSENTRFDSGDSQMGKRKEEPNYLPVVFLFAFLFFSLFLVVFVSWKTPASPAPLSTEEFFLSPNFDDWARSSNSEIPEIGLISETQSPQESEKIEVDVEPTPTNKIREFAKPNPTPTARIREEADAFIIEEVSESEAPASFSSSSSSSSSPNYGSGSSGSNGSNGSSGSSESSGSNGSTGNSAERESAEEIVEISFASDGLSLNVLLLTVLCVICTNCKPPLHS